MLKLILKWYFNIGSMILLKPYTCMTKYGSEWISGVWNMEYYFIVFGLRSWLNGHTHTKNSSLGYFAIISQAEYGNKK